MTSLGAYSHVVRQRRIKELCEQRLVPETDLAEIWKVHRKTVANMRRKGEIVGSIYDESANMHFVPIDAKRPKRWTLHIKPGPKLKPRQDKKPVKRAHPVELGSWSMWLPP